MTPKRRLSIWPEKVALLTAFLIAGAAFLCWSIGMVGLDGLPHLRFDSAMLDWTTQAELVLVPLIWLFLRVTYFGARALGRLLRSSLPSIASGELRLPV